MSWRCQQMGIGMLRPRQVALWTKYTHYSLDIQLGKQAHEQTLQKRPLPVTELLSFRKILLDYFWQSRLGLLRVKSRLSGRQCGFYWLYFGYHLHAARSTQTILKYFRASNIKKLVPSVFWPHEGKCVYCSTAKIIRWNTIRKPLSVEVQLGTIAAFNIMFLYQAPMFHYYCYRNINQSNTVKGMPM